MKKAVSLVLLLLTTVTASALAQTPSARELQAKVDQLFAQWDSTNSPGCALGVIKDGELIYQRGYGMANLEQNVPITPDTAFYIGSTSKQFTAMCIALLEEQGKISLDDDVRKYVPEMPTYDRPITINHLVHHTAGLRDFLRLWSLAGRSFADSIAEEEALDLIARQKSLNFTPGEQYSYSNSGYFLLSVIVRRASGKSLRQFAEENIFRPLGMRHTHFHDDRTMIIRRRADGHAPRADGGFAIVQTSFDLVGDGGLYTTVEDLYKWDQNFYHNRLGKGGQALIDRVLTKSRLNNGQEHFYAFGLGVNHYKGLKVVDHAGSFIGFRAELIRFPEQKFSVIVLANLATIEAGALARQVADLYLADQFKPGGATTGPGAASNSQNTPAKKSPPPHLTAEQLKEYTGDYYNDELNVIWSVRMENDRLLVKVRYHPARTLTAVSHEEFKIQGSSLVFARDPQGRVTSFKLDAGRVKNLKFVKK